MSRLPRGVVENVFHKFFTKATESYGMIFPEYISEFMTELQSFKYDSHCLICVSADTLIWVNGIKKRIGDAPDKFITKSYNEETKMFVDGIATKFNSGKKKVYKIKLKDGKEVIATAEHRWLTDKGWIKTIDLKNDTHILTYGDK